MSFDALSGILLIPAVAGALLTALPGYRATARLNVVATTLTALAKRFNQLLARDILSLRSRPKRLPGAEIEVFYFL